jgi:hypothetical protein
VSPHLKSKEGVPELLIGLERVRELVETIILTGRVRNAEPVSLMLIASPESGKTSIVLSKNCETVIALSDVTGKGIQQLCLQKKEVSHFVINDLTCVTAKKHAVSQFTISMLMAMTEEGITAVQYPNAPLLEFKEGKRGVIVCTTLQSSQDGRTWWNKTGFSSRLLPFCYSHSDALMLLIKQSIDKGKFDRRWTQPEEKPNYMVPKNAVDVQIEPATVRKVRELADYRAKQLDEQGYRRLHQYRSLAKAHALWRTTKRPVAKDVDYEFISWMDKYVSYSEAVPL